MPSAIASREVPVDTTWCRAIDVPRRWPVLSRSTWLNLIASGRVPSRTVGRARIVRVADVEAFLAGGEGRPGADTRSEATQLRGAG